MRRVLFILALAVALATGSPASAETTLSQIDGDWIVQYGDTRLGRVSGEAHIDAAAGTAEVTYKDPESGEQKVLKSKSLKLDGDTLVIELEGRSPGERDDGLSAPDIAYKFENQEKAVTVRWGENSASLPLVAMPETDRDLVRLELKVTDEVLGGVWRYRSHWFLGRAADGWGRSGDIQVDKDGIAWTEGFEDWHRPHPVVFGVIPIADQLAIRMTANATPDAYYPYPFSPSPYAAIKTRYLFVFGKDLPRKDGRKLLIEGVDPGIEYIESARMSDASANFKGKLLRDGYAKLKEEIMSDGKVSAAAADKAMSELDVLVLRADLKPEVVPGPNSFRIEGQEVAWLLQFGDNTAAIRVVRQSNRDGDRFEPTAYVYPGEMVKIEIETAHKLPVDTIPVIVGVDDQRILMGDGGGIPAGRDPENPRIYRTDFIRLNDRAVAGGAIDLDAGNGYAVLEVKQGSRINAVIAQPGLISVPPSMAQATLYEVPAEIGGDWNGWLKRAAACAHFPAAGDTDQADTISTFMFNTGRNPRIAIPGWLEDKVSVGQLAAMMAMRDTFVRQLKDRMATFAQITSDEDILAFRRQMEPIIRTGHTVIGAVEVDDLKGGPTEFYWSFEKDLLAKLEDGRVDDIERWAINVTRQALAKYQDLMNEALKHAMEIDECDAEDMLRLTGFEFEGVAAVAKTKMMLQPDPTIQWWLPNYRARGWIDTIEFLYAQLQIQEQLSAEDKVEAGLVATIISIPVALAGAGTVAAVMTTVDLFGLGHFLYSTFDQKFESDAEVRFARGAADIIGMRRLEVAEANQVSWTTVFTDVGIAVYTGSVFAMAGSLTAELRGIAMRSAAVLKLRQLWRGRTEVMKMSGVDPLKAGAGGSTRIGRLVEQTLETPGGAKPKAAEKAALNELADAVEQPKAQGPPGLGRKFEDWPDALPQKPQTVASDAVATLDHIQGAKIRSAVERETLAAAQEYVNKVQASVAKHESWGVKPAALRRPDVRALIEASEGQLSSRLRSADPKVQKAARDVLEGEPQTTIENFEKQVADLAKRQDDPMGPDYYHQARPTDPQTIKALKDAGWMVRANDDGVLRIRDPSGHVGSISRNYDPATHTYKMEFAFRETGVSHFREGMPVVKGPIDGMIKANFRVPLTSKGQIPTMQFYNMRIMNRLKIPYGSADGIRRAVMSMIVNERTIAQINWFKRTYYRNVPWNEIPEDVLMEAIMRTQSGRYGSESLATAGYRVKGARLEFGESMEPWHLPAERNFIAEQGETFDSFLARYGIDRKTKLNGGFDIVFDVEPWPR